MADDRYHAAARDAILTVSLDLLTAVYHRPSGTTHLLASPALEILAALADPADLAGLRGRLAAQFDLADHEDALAVRIAELAAVGLIEVL